MNLFPLCGMRLSGAARWSLGRTLWLLPALVLCLVSSCSSFCDPDGKWDPIKLDCDQFDVSCRKDTLRAQVRNYGGVWIIEVSVDGQRFYPDPWADTADTLRAGVIDAWVERGRDIVMAVSANEEVHDRSIVVHIECGDAFSYISIRQRSRDADVPCAQ